jgi:hypothetical protein
MRAMNLETVIQEPARPAKDRANAEATSCSFQTESLLEEDL